MSSSSSNENTGSFDHYSEALGVQISDLYAHINVATYQLLVLIAEFERNQCGAAQGFITTANWLNWRCGIGLVAAREKVRVALALTELSLVAKAFSEGKLSYSKVRAITRVANTTNEQTLLDVAQHASASQCERIFRQYQQTLARPVDCTLPEQPGNEFHCHWDEDGYLVFSGRLAPEQGALLMTTMQQHIDAGSDRADAIAVVAQAALTNADSTGNSAERYTINVDIGNTDVTGSSQSLRGGPGITDAIVERLSCDASIVAHTCDEQGEVLDVGRKTRTIPPAIRRALHKRDHGCQFPGCTHEHFVDAHHVRHWARGGETKLSNLILLCTRHHKAIHEEGFRVVALQTIHGPTVFEFYTPNATYLPPLNDDLSQGEVVALYPPCLAEAPTAPDGASAEARRARVDYRDLEPSHPTRHPDFAHINQVLVGLHPPPERE